DSGWRVHAQLHPEGRNAERLLVEVVKRAQPHIARLRALVDLMRLGRQELPMPIWKLGKAPYSSSTGKNPRFDPRRCNVKPAPASWTDGGRGPIAMPACPASVFS